MMCISLRDFFSSQLFQATDHQTQGIIEEYPVMRKGSNTSRSSSVSSSASDTESDLDPTPEDEDSRSTNRSSSVSSTDSSSNYLDLPSTSNGSPSVEKKRKSSMRRASSDSRESRRVSFHDQVNVRVYPIDEPQGFRGTPVTPPAQEAIDDIDSLTEEVSSRLSSIKAKDAPIPSLEELCDSISDVHVVDRDVVEPTQSTTPRNQIAVGYAELSDDFEQEFEEMDVIMRMRYPKYYHFLKSHMITGAIGSEDYKSQVLEFKEAIVGSRQYPDEYFQDLENTLSYYERMSGGTEL
ncbi:uncharacterized protein LOC123313656 [Coccinella septempunctata]|uniref:uncharacterized protein LOC123313656 n=1 Tax=Coccinella septempunctata TaxID=41139 RepID=UPI001D07FD79|nr:uncharacterized protein LOC123313656 [Coccinella septempunctata]